ncbi:NADH-quinone oxidoreductase subunit M [Colwellia hornerae]|uniref:NADH-quinone oxidoreductase subunit M n=2 Tax=Colwellia hornerae TaxID=89402 RepID=A0A5C6QNY7_9GAMM|nr:NADH-quinone oxidoreductase subunit M [Colwellia hornerae]TWX62207.1 NADH-quinone oxidoreductase subunit M [Colwellia hornerae]TWX70609.1 NADH-quinone oxidoreductase subunit M [Colwellia hornerae]
MLTLIVFGLLLSGCLAWFADNKVLLGIKLQAKWLSLLAVLVLSCCFLLLVYCSEKNFQQLQLFARVPWIRSFNIDYALALDQLSITLIILTFFLAVICILVSWQEIQKKTGFYYFNLLATFAGILGVFCAVDMFLFFFFWEVMLLPMTAIIAVWGHEKRYFAAVKFFIFTQVSSLLMLVAIIAMAYIHQQQTGDLSFYYQDWLMLDIKLDVAQYLMLGFFIAFAVKLPSVPVHSWLPDAHTQAPTAGSVLLAGVLLKTGAYGLIRFVIFLFPQASENFAPIAVTLAVISIIYGAKMAFAQNDFKRLVAYSSISHMGFVMLAIFSFNEIAYQGAIVTMVAHGLSSAALFALAGIIYQRVHSRNLTDMGGFWQSAPRMGGFGLAFAAAAFGLPGLANFVGEFLSLVGAFQVFPIMVIFAALGLIGSAIYAMVLFQNTFQGVPSKLVEDLSLREICICSSLLVSLIILGLYPNILLRYSFGALL